jgi:hypothetical protein
MINTVENFMEFTKEFKHDPKWVEHRFVYCEKCKKWERFCPLDETGMRTLPVTRKIRK